MATTGQVYKLGKDQVFVFPGVANIDIRSVEFNIETANEANATTRGSGNIQEFIPVHQNFSITVNALHHSTAWGNTGLCQIYPKTGFTGTNHTGVYYVNGIGEPQQLEGEIVHPITLRRFPG